MNELSLNDADELLADLEAGSDSVRIAALRAIVRLKLSREAWLEVSSHVLSLLDAPAEDKPFSSQTRRGIPYGEVIDAAVFVPTVAVRNRLHSLLSAADSDVRRSVAHTLASARDPAAASQLITELSTGSEFGGLDAAKSLSLLNEPSVLTDLRQAYRKEVDPDMRFWLALTLAQLGEAAEIKRVLRQLRRGALDLKELYGDPSRLIDQLKRRGPFPENVRKVFQRLAAEREDEDFTSQAAMCLYWAGQEQSKEEGPPLRAAPPPNAELEALASSIVQELNAKPELTNESLRPEVLPYLPQELTPRFVTLLLREAVQKVKMGVPGFMPGNEIMYAVCDLAYDFAPGTRDLRDLYACYREAEGYINLQWQIAWAMSRSPGAVGRVLGGQYETGPPDEERIIRARLIEDIALYAGQDYPPFFGGGSGPADLVPSSSLMLDEDGPHAGVESERSAMDDAQERRRRALQDSKAARSEEVGSTGVRQYSLFERLRKVFSKRVINTGFALPTRVINTGFAPRTNPDDKLKTTMPLRAGGEYYFWLDRDWPQKETSGEVTPTDIPEVPVGARLVVAVFGFKDGLQVLPGQDLGEVEVRGNGPFTVISQPMKELTPRSDYLQQRLFFPVRVPKTADTFRMRCNIYWGQILLQSRLISGRVMTQPEPTGDSEKAWRSVLDYTLSRQLDPSHLQQLTEHRLSILLNKNDDGTHSFHLFGSDGNEKLKQDDLRFGVGELQDLIKLARGSLRLASWGTVDEWDKNVYKYQDRQKKKDRLQADLINLAKWGYEFYFSIRKKLAGGAAAVAEFERLMLEPGVVQIAMKESPSYVLPAAMLYDYPLDTAAGGKFSLCPTFEKALDQTEPFENVDCFRGKCPSRGNLKVICPSGFWGFRHSLGMPLSEEGKSDVYPQILVEHELKMAVSVATNLELLGAHVKTVEQSARKLKSGLDWTYAATRDDVFDILKKAPHLVYFYCHGGLSRESLPFLQVGTEDLIFPSTLGTMQVVWNQPRPLVFINGCHTTAVDPLKALQFIGPLMTDSRSAGVIGTEITIFEELATVFAEECLARFCANEPIGQAIRNSRLKLLAEGNPLGLVYIPFVLAGLRLEYQSAPALQPV